VTALIGNTTESIF